MARYTKKPVTIDARQIGDIIDTYHADGLLESWIEDGLQVDKGEVGSIRYTTRGGKDHDQEGFYIITLEGEMFGTREWWLIRGLKGELYPCDPEIFEASYVLADEMESEADHDARMQKAAEEVAEWSKGLNQRLAENL